MLKDTQLLNGRARHELKPAGRQSQRSPLGALASPLHCRAGPGHLPLSRSHHAPSSAPHGVSWAHRVCAPWGGRTQNSIYTPERETTDTIPNSDLEARWSPCWGRPQVAGESFIPLAGLNKSQGRAELRTHKTQAEPTSQGLRPGSGGGGPRSGA